MAYLVKFISRIKGRDVQLDDNVTGIYLVHLMLIKLMAFLRGWVILRRPVFVGRHSRIMAASQLYLGKGVEFGERVEVDCLSKNGMYIGDGSKLGSYSIVKVSGSLSNVGDSIKIGKNVAIGDFSHIGGAGGVIIGNDTITGAYFSVHPENHIFSDLEKMIRLQGVTRKGIIIGRNCWIGAKVTILDGAKIGNGCVVAAGAVVRGEFPDFAIIGGVPAKILKMRCDV